MQYVFTDTSNKYMFTTTDYGRSVQSRPLDFTPDDVVFDERQPLSILAYDKTLSLHKVSF